MHPSEFNNIYLKNIRENLLHDSKTLVIMEDFYIDLMKYNIEKDSSKRFRLHVTSFLLPCIGAISWVKTHSNTLIGNILSNNIEEGSTSGNIMTAISDHYVLFLLLQMLVIKIQETVKFITKTSKNSAN